MEKKEADILNKIMKRTRPRFSDIEKILLAYTLFWTLAMGVNENSFYTYKVYEVLNGIMTERTLFVWLFLLSNAIIIGCFFRIICLRMIAMIVSVFTWTALSTSFVQSDFLNMRISVIILAAFSAVQFIRLAKEKGGRYD